MNFTFVYYKNEGSTTSYYTISDEQLDQIKNDLISIKNSGRNIHEMKLDHWSRILYFSDLYNFFVEGKTVDTTVCIKKDRLAKTRKNFYSKTSQIYNTIYLWKRGVNEVCSFTWGSDLEKEWKNTGLFISSKEYAKLEKEDLNCEVNKKLKKANISLNPDILDNFVTVKYYTLKEMESVELDPYTHITKGLILTDTGDTHLDGYWDFEHKRIENNTGWFNTPYTDIGVAVCDMVSVFPKVIRDTINDINKVSTKDKRVELHVLDKLLNDNYDLLRKTCDLTYPRLVFRGQSSGWSNLNAFASIEFFAKNKYSVFTSHGSSDNRNTYDSFEEALKHAFYVFAYPERVNVHTNFFTHEPQLRENKANVKVCNKFVKDYKQTNNFKAKKEYYFNIKAISTVSDDYSYKKVQTISRSVFAYNKDEALSEIQEFIDEHNEHEFHGYRPGWAERTKYVLKSKTARVY